MDDPYKVYEVPCIGNYYGGLDFKCIGEGKYQWSIENWDGHAWFDIPDYLYMALKRYVEENPDG